MIIKFSKKEFVFNTIDDVFNYFEKKEQYCDMSVDSDVIADAFLVAVNSRFFLEMSDHWDENDFKRSSELSQRVSTLEQEMIKRGII